MALLATTIHNVEQTLKTHPTIRRLNGKARRGLYVDLALVGLALRTGCLIDSFAPKDQVTEFSQILDRLRQDSLTSTMVAQIAHVYEPNAQQSFLLNIGCIRHRIEPICAGAWSTEAVLSPSFIKLLPPSQFELLGQVPSGLLEPLKQLCEYQIDIRHQGLPLSFTLPESLGFDIAVPLAAVILDYDVAYAPVISSGDSGSFPTFLSGVPVSTYECLLHLEPDGRGLSKPPEMSRITVMKFSCPKPLEEIDPQRFSPEVIAKRLTNRLGSRLTEAGVKAAVEVLHGTAVYERLAL